MSRTLTVLALLILSGCASFTETAKRHPYVTGFVITSLALSGAQALRHNDGPAAATPDVRAPTVDCARVSCQ